MFKVFKLKTICTLLILLSTSNVYATPYKYVITGGPCFGKTTLVKEMARRGHATVAETATYLIEDLQRQGIQAPQTNILSFQPLVLKTQIKWEAKLEEEQKEEAILDRSAIDCLAYFRLRNTEVPLDFMATVCRLKYDLVFLLNPVGIHETTEIRRESREEAMILHLLLKEVYTQLGYNVIQVPAFDHYNSLAECVQARAKFV